MSLVRNRPLPLTPIKTLGLSTWLTVLKQTAGPLGPSSLTPSEVYHPMPNQFPAEPAGDTLVLTGEDRQKDSLELSLLATHSGTQPRKMEQSKTNVIQSPCDRQPSTEMSSCSLEVCRQDVSTGNSGGLNQVLIGSTTNWLLQCNKGKAND